MSTLPSTPSSGMPLEQLVAVQRPLAEEQQQRRLDVALYACVDVPVARPDEPPAPRPWMTVVPHRHQYR